MSEHPNLRRLNHPLAEVLLTRLRDEATEPSGFHATLDQLSHLIAAEVSRLIVTDSIEVTTPLEQTAGKVLNEPIVKVPILRAGLALLPGFDALFPDAPVGMLGVARNHETLQPEPYLEKLPPMKGCLVLVLDPMLATGGSAAYAIDHLRAAGAERIALATVLAAPEGVKLVHEKAPDVPVVTVALERQLNEHGYILPGLGDAGDRYFGA